MSSSDSLFLAQRSDTPSAVGKAFGHWIRRTRIWILLIILLMVAGFSAYVQLPRELNPEVEIPAVSISTVLPGAAPDDVERLISQPIEQEVSSLSQIDTYSSTSRTGVSTVTVQFEGSVDPDDALQDVKTRVDRVSDLPEDASTPMVQSFDASEQPVWQVALAGTVDVYSLSRTAEQLESVLERESSIDRVELQGTVQDQIGIVLSPAAIAQYDLNPQQLIQSLRSNQDNIPAGSLTVSGLEYQLVIEDPVQDIESLRQLPVQTGRGTVPLEELATVRWQAAESNIETLVRVNTEENADQLGKYENAVLINVYKSEGAKISDAVVDAQKIIDGELDGSAIRSNSVVDLSQDIDEQFTELTNNALTTILLVFLVLFTFVGARQALTAALSIPLTFLSTFVIMQLTGISLNFLSLFSLLLALGLVVDDAIVIVEAYNRYRKRYPAVIAGQLVFEDFVIPIWTTTITTVWAFVPLLFAPGIIGEFIFTIPVVVTATLLSSTSVAVFLTLPLAAAIEEFDARRLPGAGLVSGGVSKIRTYVASTQQDRFSAIFSDGLIDFGVIRDRYTIALRWVLQSRWHRATVYGASIALVVIAGVSLGAGWVQSEFFPSEDTTEVFIDIDAPAGWTVEQTRESLLQISDEVSTHPAVDRVFPKTGGGNVFAGGPGGGSGGSGGSASTANITVILKDARDRDISSQQLVAEWQLDLNDTFAVDIEVSAAQGGPPVGSDLQVNIKGDDLGTLEQIANDFATMVEEIETDDGVTAARNVSVSLEDSPGQLAVDFDQEALAARGLTTQQVNGWLRTAVTGTEIGTIRGGVQEDDVSLQVQLDTTQRLLSALQSLELQGPQGSYTLDEVSDITLEASPGTIEREGSERVVRVTATAAELPSPELLSRFQEQADDYQLPMGYSWDVGGANEENQESTQAIISFMGLAILLIMGTMVLQLDSFRQAIMVVLVIPLAVAGVFTNFALFSIPLSFPALIGVLALFGIVVNNSIMLMEKINQNIRAGLEFMDSVVDACGARIEAITFTSLTTAIGLLPITISDPLWRGLGGAIIAGLSVSGLIILFLLPALQVELFGEKE